MSRVRLRKTKMDDHTATGRSKIYELTLVYIVNAGQLTKTLLDGVTRDRFVFSIYMTLVLVHPFFVSNTASYH